MCGTGGSGNAMPELTIGMMIALTRNFAQEDAAVRAGGWQHTIGPGLSGATLGVVGLGRLGVPVATLAQAFGMTVIAWSPNLTPARAEPHGVRAVDKRELFSTADVITIHMPLSDASRGLIGGADLALMKPVVAQHAPSATHRVRDERQLPHVLRPGRRRHRCVHRRNARPWSSTTAAAADEPTGDLRSVGRVLETLCQPERVWATGCIPKSPLIQSFSGPHAPSVSQRSRY